MGKILWCVDGAAVGGEGSDAEIWVACLEAGGADQILGDGSAVVGGGRETEWEEEEEAERVESHDGVLGEVGRVWSNEGENF